MKYWITSLLCLQMIVSALPASADTQSDLTATEIASLQLMREEEKLAYDVYCHLYDLYKDRPFSNISSAEQRHTDAVIWLMQQYGVRDRGNTQPGKFNNPELQELYDKLIELGEESREMAFVVGVIIEETDIADLDKSLEATDNADLIRVYENLRSGSYRHLSAFQSGLKRVSRDPEAAREKALEAIGKLVHPVT